MTSRPRMKPVPDTAESNRADKGFEEVAERIFRDDAPAEPLFRILDHPDERPRNASAHF